MTIKTSTGLRTEMLSGNSFKGTMDDGFVKIYGGTVPTDADAALGGATLICTITESSDGSTGLTFDAAVAGIIAKAAAETWGGINVASGTATFYRHVGPGADAGGASTSLPRIQGTIATAGADMNISNPVLVSAAPQALDFYTVALPTG